MLPKRSYEDRRDNFVEAIAMVNKLSDALISDPLSSDDHYRVAQLTILNAILTGLDLLLEATERGQNR